MMDHTQTTAAHHLFLLLFLLIVITSSTPMLLYVLRHTWKKEGRIVEETSSRLPAPPGPWRLPLIGNLHQLGDVPHRSLQRLSNKYGPLMFLYLGSVPTLVVSSSDMARQVFKTHDLVFSGRPILYAAKKLSYGCLSIGFSPYSEYWREVRKITMSELLSVRRVQSFRAVREAEVALMLASINASSTAHPINLSEMLLFVVNNVVCQVAFGRKYNTTEGAGKNISKSRFHTVLQETQDLLGCFSVADFFPWLTWVHKMDGLEARLEKNFRQLDSFYDTVIEEHLINSNKPRRELEDLVDVLLRIQNDPNGGIALNRDKIKGIITDVFIAGSDTSSAAIVWTLTELIRNPTITKKTQEEVRQVVGKKEMVEESDLQQLSYLKLVVKEAMRLHPPAPLLVPRETTEKCIINGYHIPAKTRVIINAKSIETDPKTWENPEKFWPERFLNKPIDFRGVDFELIPFGAGRRSCPGINFAVVLIELVLANLLYCFNWELPRGMKRDDVDMEEACGLVMHKKYPLCLVATSANVSKNA